MRLVNIVLSLFMLPTVLVGSTGCGGHVPEDPAERAAFIRTRVETEESGVKATYWMSLVSDDYSVETRDLFLELLNDPRHMVSNGAAFHLTKEVWLEDDGVRQRLIEIYTNPLESRRQRQIIRDRITDDLRLRFPDLAALPPSIEMPAGVAVIAPHGEG